MSDKVIPEELYLDLLAFVKQMGLQGKLSFTFHDQAFELVQALSALPSAAALAPAASSGAEAGDDGLLSLVREWQTLVIHERLANRSWDSLSEEQRAIKVGTEYQRSSRRINLEHRVLDLDLPAPAGAE